MRRILNRKLPLFLIVSAMLMQSGNALAQSVTKVLNDLEAGEEKIPESAKPWVFWYWMHESFSREGIKADLEAMKYAGIGGAYLAPIKGKTNPPLFEPVIETLSPEWWQLIRYTLEEADSLGIKIALLPNDGFATAGGSWITPELSMQKVVWSKAQAKGGTVFNDTLPTPENYKGYYRDIAVFAYPTPTGESISTETIVPKVTTSKQGVNAQFLVKKGNKENFSSSEPCWIQYEFDKPFTCRSIKIHVNNFNYQSQRLIIQVSDDGKNFQKVGRLEPPRAGWEDWDADVTHQIIPVTARFFRFIYDPAGSEPGAEDLDAAKWKQSLKIAGIELSSEARLHQFEGKTGEVWRISKRTTPEQVPDSLCVPINRIINITQYLDSNGRLKWNSPKGNWTILRMGYTSTGHMNETAGTGKGLEVDKFNPEAVKLQFGKWFGEAVKVAGPELASRVLKIFHVDSWECGSQNWSPVFREEFKKRRGYDLLSYLPAMAGVPVQNVDVSERFLYDIRQTISDLMVNNFFKTLADLAHSKGATFTSETTAPVMTADGMIHFREVDVPMGEFWLRSPSHDKPNDMLDAISGARVYGKPIVQAEAFTEIRMAWDEHPGNLKTLQDRNYALGVNRLVYHIYTHNPWMDRKPGMTLDGIGLYFQRDQTWWKPGKAWVDYAQRCQALLQQGHPVADIAVFTGEEIPRRAVLPDRLVSTLPGIFGKEVVESEQKRLANIGLPIRKIEGVTTSANMADPENWVDPLRGYAYDSFNKDVLLRSATVRNGRVEFSGGASYGLLVFPAKQQMNPNSKQMSAEVASKLLELVKSGATILLSEQAEYTPGLHNAEANDQKLARIIDELWGGEFSQIKDASGSFLFKNLGKGRVLKGSFGAGSFDHLGIERDIITQDSSGGYAGDIAWTHRNDGKADIYFISNQQGKSREVLFSFRIDGMQPELYDAVTNKTRPVNQWRVENGRTILPLKLEPNASLFVIFKDPVPAKTVQNGKNWTEVKTLKNLNGEWKVSFNKEYGGPEKPVVFNSLTDWSKHPDSLIRYYSGTAIYTTSFKANFSSKQPVWLDLGKVANIADVKVNGVSCGIVWTPPYRVDISKALRKGKNQLSIAVTNTWANRLIGDHNLPEEKRITRTTAPFRLEGRPLLEAGLIGPVTLQTENKNQD